MTINNFRDLDAWKVAMELAIRIYEVVDLLPPRLGYWNEATAKRLDDDLTRMSQLLHGVLRSIQRQLAVKAVTLVAVLRVALVVQRGFA